MRSRTADEGAGGAGAGRRAVAAPTGFLDPRYRPRRLAAGRRSSASRSLSPAPWYAASACGEPGFAAYFFWSTTSCASSPPFDHARPVWFYLPGLLLGMLPWTLLLPGLAPCRRSARRRRGGRRRWASARLAAVVLVFFSAAGCKRPGLHPAGAAAAGVALGCYLDGRLARAGRRRPGRPCGGGLRRLAFRAARLVLLLGAGAVAAAGAAALVQAVGRRRRWRGGAGGRWRRRRRGGGGCRGRRAPRRCSPCCSRASTGCCPPITASSPSGPAPRPRPGAGRRRRPAGRLLPAAAGTRRASTCRTPTCGPALSGERGAWWPTCGPAGHASAGQGRPGDGRVAARPPLSAEFVAKGGQRGRSWSAGCGPRGGQVAAGCSPGARAAPKDCLVLGRESVVHSLREWRPCDHFMPSAASSTRGASGPHSRIVRASLSLSPRRSPILSAAAARG